MRKPCQSSRPGNFESRPERGEKRTVRVHRHSFMHHIETVVPLAVHKQRGNRYTFALRPASGRINEQRRPGEAAPDFSGIDPGPAGILGRAGLRIAATILGLLGAVIALGEGVAVVAAFSLLRFGSMRQRYGTRYWLLWVAGITGILGGIYYNYLRLQFGHTPITYHTILSILISAKTPLFPVMWWSFAVWAFHAYNLASAIIRSDLPQH